MIGNWNIDPAEGGKISAADLRQLMDVVYSLSMASAAPPLFIERTPGGIIFRIATEEIASSSSSTPVAKACKVYNSTEQLVQYFIYTALSWDSEEIDTDTMHTGATPSRLTIATAGKYLFVASLAWTANAIGSRTIAISKNNADLRGPGGWKAANTQMAAPVDTAVTYHRQQVTLIDSAVIGDYYEVECWQTSGTTLGILSSISSVTGAASNFAANLLGT